MADVVDAATRSRMMAGIRTQGTKPEIIIRKALHARGFRYSLHSKGMPGKPDIVMPRWRVAIFVHGCFWHQHGCHLSKMPATNMDFWEKKLAGNKLRDEKVTQALVAMGWRTATIWECTTRGPSALERLPGLMDELANWIRSGPEPTSFNLKP